jgi:hypothetical protein
MDSISRHLSNAKLSTAAIRADSSPGPPPATRLIETRKANPKTKPNTIRDHVKTLTILTIQIVVGENNYRPSFQLRIEDPLAGYVKVIAVDQGDRHVPVPKVQETG